MTNILDHIDLTIAPEDMSPLVLAYIGDAVYELYVRLLIVAHGTGKMKDLHHKAVSFVKAETQAGFLKEIEPMLSPHERNIVRWGRNAKSGQAPKRAQVLDYRHSTGFEALLGYLYLTGRYDRLAQIMAQVEKLMAEKEGDHE